MTDDLRDNENLYDTRDTIEQGNWFVAHMHHMTTENLRSKAEIAAELAHRDIQIEKLKAVANAAKALTNAQKPPFEGVESTNQWWDFCYALGALEQDND